MAAKKKEELRTYKVTVKDNPGYCGEGAGGAQFAHGSALITSDRLAAWHREPRRYAVEEVGKPEEDADVKE